MSREQGHKSILRNAQGEFYESPTRVAASQPRRVKGRNVWGLCRVLRVMEITRNSLNLRTGETTLLSRDMVVQDCAVPLFTGDNINLGVCRSCANGYVHEKNRFATEEDI